MRVSLEHPQPVLGYFQMGRLADTDPELTEVFRERSAGIRATIEDLVEAARERGELSADVDTEELVDSVSGLLWAMTAGASQAAERAHSTTADPGGGPAAAPATLERSAELTESPVKSG